MLHVAAAFCLVGGSTAAAILNALAIRSERPSEAGFLLKLIRYALPLIFAGVIGTLASALGGRGGRHQEQVREAAEKEAAAGDTMSAELRARLRDPKALAVNYAAGVATIAVLVVMIWKPGS